MFEIRRIKTRFAGYGKRLDHMMIGDSRSS
uniref:Uncharacterized protein n=1 Tax=Medicago truncatula TaxID=3880 RepID=I3SR54_MEDTR|nr:unknown [Medicago truncatula]